MNVARSQHCAPSLCKAIFHYLVGFGTFERCEATTFQVPFAPRTSVFTAIYLGEI